METSQNLSMALSSILSISAGGSAGSEAPLVQITGSFGNWFAKKLRLTGEEYRSMTIAGMAAGFTSGVRYLLFRYYNIDTFCRRKIYADFFSYFDFLENLCD
ncbi:chloride transporter, ClC domain protein [Leptospira noguchii str. 2007001578]|uniref:Chloride transporter, ClC domain protein n=1 Tax=Leptospira noguchii str. 2007001578 TaxID=1049974 RepID=A0ABP2TCR7_9LEPT|nr:chloride transporter, ClC domain protein [Leptospira noguchii str. 2007001578]